MRLVVSIASALCLAAGAARADDDQAAKDRAFEQGAAADAAEGAKAGLPLPAATTAELGKIEERRKPPPRWGLLVAGGFPDGLSASAAFRPVSEIRLYAGPMWNYVGWGAHAGVTLVPWQVGVSPILSFEGGRYFSADATFLAGKAGGVPAEIEPLLRHVSYDYAAAYVGIEIGTRDGFSLSLRAGLSYLTMTAKGTATTSVTSGTTTAAVSFRDPNVRGTVPCVQLGVQTWF